MNILELLKIEHYDFIYHGESDMITPYYAQWLAQKNEDIEKYFSDNYDYSFDNADKLIDYFTVTTFTQYPQIAQNKLELEQDTDRKNLLLKQNKILTFFKQIEANYDKRKLPKYIITNAKKFFKDDEEKKAFILLMLSLE